MEVVKFIHVKTNNIAAMSLIKYIFSMCNLSKNHERRHKKNIPLRNSIKIT